MFAPLRQADYWRLLVTASFSNIILYGVITWLPTYLANGRHVAEADQAGLVAAPYGRERSRFRAGRSSATS